MGSEPIGFSDNHRVLKDIRILIRREIRNAEFTRILTNHFQINVSLEYYTRS